VNRPAVVPGCIIFALAATKVRPCVVLAVDAANTVATIAPCRGSERGSCVEVKLGCQAAIAMRLTKPTYFHEKIERVSVAAITEITTLRCPPDLFLKIKRHVGFR